jgi:putative endonuclease
MAEHNDLGKWGEAQARLFLEQKGYLVIEQNWYYQKSEIDIICQKDKEIIFVEVKTLMHSDGDLPEDQITQKKEKLITEAANAYIESKGIRLEARFDIISIIKKDRTIRHLQDAFRAKIN